MKTEIQFLRGLKKLSHNQVLTAIDERLDELTKRDDARFFEDDELNEMFIEYLNDWEETHRRKIGSRRLTKRIKMIQLFNDLTIQKRIVAYNGDQLHLGFYLPSDIQRELQNQINGTQKKIGRAAAPNPARLAERFDYQ